MNIVCDMPCNLLKNRVKLVFFSFTIVLISACSSSVRPIHSDEVIQIVFDAKNPFTDFYASSLFHSPKTIILETTKESLIGTINSLQVFDNKIFILDGYMAKKLFIFDMNGKFISQIGNFGKGPGEYIDISDFTINVDEKHIYIRDNQSIHQYTTEGVFIRTINILNPYKKDLTYIQYYNGYIFAEAEIYPESNNDEMFLKIDPSNGKIIEQYFKSSEYNYGWYGKTKMETGSFKACLNKPPKFSLTFMHQIVSLDNMQPYIEIITDHLATNEDINRLKRDEIKLWDFPKMHSIHNYVESNSFIFFSLWYNAGYYSILYDIHKKTNTVGFLMNDLVYKNLRMITKFQFSDNKGAYSAISPDGLFYLIESMKNNELIENLDKIDQLRKLDEESNPVIFYYEFK